MGEAIKARRKAGAPAAFANFAASNKRLLNAISLKRRAERKRERAEREGMGVVDWESFLLESRYRRESQERLHDEIDREFIAHQPPASIRS
jgi:hypothetical protein